jgi:hypothetical protein
MGKTRRVNVYRKKTKRLYGGNRYGQDTELLMLKLQNIRNNELILDSFSAAGLRITHLPPLPDSLEKLSVHSSFLTSLPDPLPSNLRHLEMIGTPIHNLVIIMAVEDEQPLVFQEKTEDHIEGLVKAIKFYNDQKW